jgi:two-component system cell cycle sensor histidine kinase/response regulator CckA
LKRRNTHEPWTEKAARVSDGVEEPSGLALVRFMPGPQPAVLFGVGLAVAVAAAVASAPGVTFVFAAMAGGLFGAAALVYARGVFQGARRRRGFERTLGLIRHDPAPSFITLDTGEIAAQNLAAEQRFGPRQGQPMARALAGLLPNAAAVVFRHETAVEHGGAVQEAIMTSRGPVRLVAHALDGGVLWRLDEADEALNSGQRIGLPMMVVSHADTVLSMNDAMRRLLGRSVEALADAFPERPLVPGRRTRMMAGDGAIEVVPVILSSQDGRREVYAVPGLAEPPAASVAARAFEALPVALLHLGSEGEVLASNRQAQVLLGISPDERGHLSSLVDGPGRPVRDWVAESLKGSASKRTEVVRARRRADECFLQIALSRITDDTGPSLLAVLHDATELKTLEQQFVQSQKMQAVGELAGGVAHDFNNILTAITGHCDLLLLRHDHGDEDYGDLIQINQNANRAAALVGQLLAFSRQQTLQPEVIDLRDTIGELIHLLNRLLGEKITLVTRHDQGLLPVRVDRRQLDQVIMNLVVNARDAMPDGGEIRVETRTVHLREPLRRDNAVVPVGHYVTIRVRDDGMGIPPDRLRRIFEPFFTTKDVGKGTGLGLSMAYGIVKQTGGFIFVDSVVDAGTTFTIYIPAHDPSVEQRARPAAGRLPAPVAPSAEPAAAERIARPEPGAAARPEQGRSAPEAAASTGRAERGQVILLVEDEAPVRAFASRALELRGYTVLEAANAEAALEVVRATQSEIDLFVTDVVMPGKDGPTWVREALATRGDVKVVFVSGYSQADLSELTDGIPNAVFLPKPFSLAELSQTVAEQLR